MREIVLDTETTGIDPQKGHRIVEIGAIELLNHMPTGKFFHSYLNPQRDMPKEAEAVHGLSAEFLKDKPGFEEVAEDFLGFVADSPLVIHNAAFDIGFLNAELGYIHKSQLEWDRIVDTLALARKKFPMAANSLDALCKRFGVDASRRTKHGALLDSELLAEVYLELVGGRQISLSLREENSRAAMLSTGQSANTPRRERSLPARLTEDEITAHGSLVQDLAGKSLWRAD
jgi:DNA polymerase III subunit epsilon